MVNFGTPLASSTFSRVSSTLSRDVILGNVRRLQEQLLLLNEQLSTGIRLTRPSVDPVSTQRVLGYEASVRRATQSVRNIQTSLSRFEVADKVAEDGNDIISKAKTILLQQIQSTATTQTRQVAAGEINNLLTRAVGLGNTRFEGRYLLGGTQTQAPPVVNQDGMIAFKGTNDDILTNVDENLSLNSNVRLDDLFTVFSTEIRGQAPGTQVPVDLDPALLSTTPLSALNAGGGVPLGSILVSGAASATIDLTIAETVEDVVTLINVETATTAVSASFTSTGLVLTRLGPGLVRVDEVLNGVTADRLGVFTGAVGVASPLVGTDLDPVVTGQTQIQDFNLGTGISLSGITITQEDPGGALTTATFTLTATTTVEQFLDEINTSSIGVHARLNEDGTGIDIFSRLSGSRMRILENGGTTAADLGLLYTVGRANIHDLNDGMGLGLVDGSDMRVTRKDGVVVYFDLDAATTVQDLVTLINADAGLNAALNPSGGITVTDVTGGVGSLLIQNFNGSFAATNLNVAGSTAGVFISGAALDFEGVQVEGLYTGLIRLRDALLADDTDAIGNARRLLDLSADKVDTGRAEAGARAAAFELTKNRLENHKVELQKFISIDKDIDMATTISDFQTTQTILQSALLVAARTLQVSVLNFL